MSIFDDSWLEDHPALAEADPILRRLAEAGARIRRETAEAGEPITQLRGLPTGRGGDRGRQRGAVHPGDAGAGLPGAVRGLAHARPARLGRRPRPGGGDGQRRRPRRRLVATVHEAVRRGCQLLIACPPVSTIAEHAGSRSTILLPTATADPLAAAIVVAVRRCTGCSWGPRSTRAVADAHGPGRRGLLAVRRRRGEPGQGPGHSGWPRRSRWSGAARCWPPAPAAGSPRRCAPPAAGPPWPPTPTSCCPCWTRPRRATRSPIPSRTRCRPTGDRRW